MEKRIIIFFVILIFYNYISTNEILQGVYSINPIQKSKNFIKNFSKISLRTFKIYVALFKNYLRIIPVYNDKYNIESLTNDKRLAVDNENNVKLVYKDSDNYMSNIYWNIIKINDNEYLIQNNKTHNFLEEHFYSVNCSNDISDVIFKNDYKNISNNFKFKIVKIYEEAETKNENMKYIDNEPIDVVIKYIDISDKTLYRKGIHQIFKDEEHEELRYSVRSIFENIPWFRKIFIVMPNEKVKYFKPIDEIKDRIVYIKDKDLIGFDTASVLNFFLRLWNLAKFNVSSNIILMDDDYFIGKPIKKSDFFYYDEEQKKILPSIVSDEFKVLNKESVYKEFDNLFSKKDKINPHTAEGW